MACLGERIFVATANGHMLTYSVKLNPKVEFNLVKHWEWFCQKMCTGVGLYQEIIAIPCMEIHTHTIWQKKEFHKCIYCQFLQRVHQLLHFLSLTFYSIWCKRTHFHAMVEFFLLLNCVCNVKQCLNFFVPMQIRCLLSSLELTDESMEVLLAIKLICENEQFRKLIRLDECNCTPTLRQKLNTQILNRLLLLLLLQNKRRNEGRLFKTIYKKRSESISTIYVTLSIGILDMKNKKVFEEGSEKM